ncbi:uncharacterized protein B0H18DRAFT_1210807 [Fomitopsis serialis]|uniref:uncharacterized protein n=1 Tax=Fomitopsis serialis TaxID=139415 RepID=UPI002008AAC3|nr:uncharacterized protein B0H18DRAFT_1210807 [Neoantrodia serialis]KAH9926893.1 hypothetical protein B0H18DRAFT_1210807 [Neoantrodia serialis]
MTWVFGWPLYDDDALKIAKTRNLVKDPNAGNYRRIEVAQLWVADQVGIVPALSCRVNDVPEIVFAIYVDYGDNRYPPTDIILENMTMSDNLKQYRRLKKEMVDEEIDNSDEGSAEGSDTSNDGNSDRGEDDNDNTSTSSDDEDTLARACDNETVTDGVVSRSDLSAEGSSPSELLRGGHIASRWPLKCLLYIR